MCLPCHQFVEGVERGLQLQHYLDLKNKVSQEYLKKEKNGLR